MGGVKALYSVQGRCEGGRQGVLRVQKVCGSARPKVHAANMITVVATLHNINRGRREVVPVFNRALRG